MRNIEYVVTMDPKRRILRDAAIYIENGKFTDIGPSTNLSKIYHNAEEVVDASRKAVFPGLVNTHTHLYQTLLKGLGDDLVLKDWIQTVVVPSTRRLSPEYVRAASMLGVVEAIKSGTTTTIDFNYPHPVAELSQAILDSFRQSGIRGIVGHGVIDTGEEVGLPSEIIHQPDYFLKEVRRLHNLTKSERDGRLGVWIAPVAIWGITKEGLQASRQLADELDIGITIHVSETPFLLENCKSRFGLREFELFDKIGFAGPDLLAVHCVYVNEADLKLMKKNNIKVSHNPTSNMYLSSGVAPVPNMIKEGIVVGLGVDGAASNNNQDMIQLLKTTALLHKVAHPEDPTIISAEQVLEMATLGGARALGLQNEIGSIEVGKKADLILADLDGVFAGPVHNPISSLIYSMTSENIESVIIDGMTVMKNRKFCFLDESSIIKQATLSAASLVHDAKLDHRSLLNKKSLFKTSCPRSLLNFFNLERL